MGCGGFSRRDISLARFSQNNPGAIDFDGINTYTVVDDVTVPFLINIAMKADELLIINFGVTFTILGAVSNFEVDEYTIGNSDIITNLGTINTEDRSGICFGKTNTNVNSCIKNEGIFNKNGGEITINMLDQSEGIINEGTFNFNKGPFIVKDMSGGTSSVAIKNLGDFNVTGGSISIPDLLGGGIGIQYDSGTFTFTSGSITIGNIQGGSNGILGNGGNFIQTDGSITIGELNNLGCRAIQIYGTFTKNGGSINIGNIGNSAIGIEVNNIGNFIQTDGSITIGDISNLEGRAIQINGTFTKNGGSINIGNIGNSAYGIEVDNSGNFIQTDGAITIGNISNLSFGINVGAVFTQNGGSITIGELTDSAGFFNTATSTLKNIDIGNITSINENSFGITNLSTLNIQDGNMNIGDITVNDQLSAGINNFSDLTIENSSVNLGNIIKPGTFGDSIGIFNNEGGTYDLTINNSNITISQISDGRGIGCADNGGNIGVTLTNNSTIIVTEPTDNSGFGFTTLNNTVNNQAGCTINMNTGTGYTPYNPVKTEPLWAGGGTYLPSISFINL